MCQATLEQYCKKKDCTQGALLKRQTPFEGSTIIIIEGYTILIICIFYTLGTKKYYLKIYSLFGPSSTSQKVSLEHEDQNER